MKLLVTDDTSIEVGFDTIRMSSIEFNGLHSHPYIASSRFDVVLIDLRYKVTVGYLKPLMATTIVIPIVSGDVNPNAVGLLCELYPDYAAKLRVLYIRDKDAFYELVNELKTKFEWESFY